MKLPSFLAAVIMVQASMWMVFSILAIYALQRTWTAIGALILWLIVSSMIIAWMHEKDVADKLSEVKNGNSKKRKRV